MKKILSLLLFFFIFLSMCAQAQPTITFSSPETTYDIGDTFNVSVILDQTDYQKDNSGESLNGFIFKYITFQDAGILSGTHEISKYWKSVPSSAGGNYQDKGTLYNSTGIIENCQAGYGSEFYIKNVSFLLNITFTALTSGTVTITSNNAELLKKDASNFYDFSINPLTITINEEEQPPDPPNPPSPPNGGGGGGYIPPAPPVDSDGDGVPDTSDICPGHDDNIDFDNDTIPDGCDETPYGDPEPPQNNTNTTDPPIEKPFLYANITFDNKTYLTGEKVNFSAKYSTGNISYYHWEFGDGIAVEKFIKTSHNYTTPGNYTITLTVSDNSGNTSQAFVNVTIKARPPQPKPIPEVKEDYSVSIIILIVGIVIFIYLYLHFKNMGLI